MSTGQLNLLLRVCGRNEAREGRKEGREEGRKEGLVDGEAGWLVTAVPQK